MEINREKFRVAALLIALANGGCVARQSQINFREEETSWTGSATPPTVVTPGPGPTAEGYGYPTPGYYPPPSEYMPPPSQEYYPPPQEYIPPPMEYGPIPE
jgi:hypothetical protein